MVSKPNRSHISFAFTIDDKSLFKHKDPKEARVSYSGPRITGAFSFIFTYLQHVIKVQSEHIPLLARTVSVIVDPVIFEASGKLDLVQFFTGKPPIFSKPSTPPAVPFVDNASTLPTVYPGAFGGFTAFLASSERSLTLSGSDR